MRVKSSIHITDQPLSLRFSKTEFSKFANAHDDMSSCGQGFLAVILLLTIMGMSVESVEEGNDTFLSNRSMRNLIATVRFDNGSDAEIPHYSDIVIGPRRYASIENNIESGKVFVEISVQGARERQKFELNIGTDRGLVAMDNQDRWGVDIFRSVYKSVNVPKGDALATLYPP